MIIGLLICTIGIIPLVLALSIRKNYNESKLSFGLFVYMLLIMLWQLDVGVLYFENTWNKEVVLFLFRFLRLALIFSIPTVYYVAYLIIENQSQMVQVRKLERWLKFIFNRKALYILITWSSVIYLINWTKLGIVDMRVKHVDHSAVSFYFPEYGLLNWIFILHVCSFILMLTIVFIISKFIQNKDMRHFLRAFSIYSILLEVTGVFNLFPEYGILSSSVGVIIFSTAIMFEFIKTNLNMKLNYYQLLERQKKLDYTGNLAGSLIHEVKNTNEIIKGFSTMLMKGNSVTGNDKTAVEMVYKASEHLGELANNYREYMKSAKMSFSIEALDSIIYESIELSSELIHQNQVDLKFINPYKPLKAYVSKTYMEQVFINLIRNSIEAMPKDRENKTITIETEFIQDRIVIHFIDTGKGISPQNWESVFDPFISFKSRGMGLGLPFVKKVIIEHLGTIHIVQSTSSGTHFQIEIPQNGVLNSNVV